MFDVKVQRYVQLKVRSYLNISTGLGFHGSILSLTRFGLSDVKYSHTRYKLRRCDSPDHVWTLFSPRDRKTKENAHPGGHPSLSLTPSLPLSHAHPSSTPYADRFHWLSTTHLVESLPGGFDRIFPASGLVRNSTCASRVCELHISRE